jgi:D-tyrosyl-tRNA(Tyr) deacylase
MAASEGDAMRAVVQRVRRAAVTVAGETVGEIGPGLLILLGVHQQDTAADAAFVAEKCANLRIFSDADGKFNLSALDVGGGLLAISQFTLYGDCRRGRRPSFTDAAPPAVAEPLYEAFVAALRQTGLVVATGRFGAHMQVALENDGPVTVLVESK